MNLTATCWPVARSAQSSTKPNVPELRARIWWVFLLRKNGERNMRTRSRSRSRARWTSKAPLLFLFFSLLRAFLGSNLVLASPSHSAMDTRDLCTSSRARASLKKRAQGTEKAEKRRRHLRRSRCQSIDKKVFVALSSSFFHSRVTLSPCQPLRRPAATSDERRRRRRPSHQRPTL